MTADQIAALLYLVAIGSAGMLAAVGFDVWINTPQRTRTLYGTNAGRRTRW